MSDDFNVSISNDDIKTVIDENINEIKYYIDEADEVLESDGRACFTLEAADMEINDEDDATELLIEQSCANSTTVDIDFDCLTDEQLEYAKNYVSNKFKELGYVWMIDDAVIIVKNA